jgi:hypothetical protein
VPHGEPANLILNENLEQVRAVVMDARVLLQRAAAWQNGSAKCKMSARPAVRQARSRHIPVSVRAPDSQCTLETKSLARILSAPMAARTSWSSLISALSWIRLLPYDHLFDCVGFCQLNCRPSTASVRGHVLRPDGEPGEGHLVKGVADLELENGFEVAAREHLQAEEQEHKARLASERVCAVTDERM